jgi:hypothetical protein
MIENDELGRIGKGKLVAEFMALSQQVPGGTERKTTKKLRLNNLCPSRDSNVGLSDYA